MLLIRSLLFSGLMYALMGVMGILCAPMALWSVDGAYRAMKAYCAAVFWLLRVICGLRVEIRGPVPEGNVIVAAKHQSFLDIMMLMHSLPRARFIMKAELRWAPVLGLYAMRIGSTPLARKDRVRAIRQITAEREGEGQLVIYPQGTRILPGVAAPYKIGVGVLYQRLGLPCAPAGTNAGVFWARRSWYRRPGVAVMEFLPPIPPGQSIPELMAELETSVEASSNRLMQEAGFPVAAAPPASASLAARPETLRDE